MKTTKKKPAKRRPPKVTLKFANEDIVITDPCYLIESREDWLEICRILDKDSTPQLAPERHGKMILANTLYGDWFCELARHDGESTETVGNFAADSGTVCVAALTAEYESQLGGRCPDLFTVIRGFTGKAVITHRRGECVVELTGTSGGREYVWWSRQVG